MVRSAVVTSNPASDRPARTPISHALPVEPPPPSTNARSPVECREMECREVDWRGEEDVVFMGVAFRDRLSGAPDVDYDSRAIVNCGGAPTADTAFMGLTSRR
ncbi:hypothetical protein GCM10023147_49020 [Tsukamurella soli]|uniref:Uncharacterized protein n=1 Tax=Tsukamurella soli TaxID=644556 RepID=A0ABP8KG32_9ACTN